MAETLEVIRKEIYILKKIREREKNCQEDSCTKMKDGEMRLIPTKELYQQTKEEVELMEKSRLQFYLLGILLVADRDRLTKRIFEFEGLKKKIPNYFVK